MKKYYIAFVLLLAVAIGLAGYTIYQGTLAKQDSKVQKQAEDIASDLNDYVDSENKIPASLEEAGIDDVPEAITYERNSDEKYTFCINYKTASRGYGVGAWELATATAFQSYYGGYDDYDYGPDSYLYVNTFTHNKGKDCYEVEPVLEDESDFNSSDQSYCDPSYQYYNLYKSFCEEDDSTDTLTN